MKILIALGGNALLRRDQVLSAENQIENIRSAAAQLARIALAHTLVITHGNGPQVGLLSLQAAAYHGVAPYPLDVLGAQTEGMIGYLLEQELANLLPVSRTITTLVTRVEVDAHDPAFKHPTKPIGPMYTRAQAQLLAKENGWRVAPDGAGFRRVVASPQPLKVIGLQAIKWLLEHDAIVIAAGGGGIPVARNAVTTASTGVVHGGVHSALHGVEAVIDKDLCSGLLATALDVDCLIIATDVAAVFTDWGLPTQQAIDHVTPQVLASIRFPEGSMGPKVAAARKFVLATKKRAVIGSLNEIENMLLGKAGTTISMEGATAV